NRMAAGAVPGILPNHGKTIYPSSHIPSIFPRIHHKTQNQRNSHIQSFDTYLSYSKMSLHFRETQLKYSHPAVLKYLVQNGMCLWCLMFERHSLEADHTMIIHLTLHHRMICPVLSDGKSFQSCMKTHCHICSKEMA